MRLLGVCTREQPLTILIEFMANGSLSDYLSASKPTAEGVVELLPHELSGMCRDVASGLAFLTSHGFIHRDVAARCVRSQESCACFALIRLRTL